MTNPHILFPKDQEATEEAVVSMVLTPSIGITGRRSGPFSSHLASSHLSPKKLLSETFHPFIL